MLLSSPYTVSSFRETLVSKMPSPQVLQPVLKVKVDELFLNWLSDPGTQSVLKDFLDLIKSGEYNGLSSGNAQDKKSLSFNENNNVASQKNLSEKKPLGTNSSPAPNSTLPSRSSSNARVTGPNGRVLRRSVSTKKVNNLFKHKVITWTLHYDGFRHKMCSPVFPFLYLHPSIVFCLTRSGHSSTRSSREAQVFLSSATYFISFGAIPRCFQAGMET